MQIYLHYIQMVRDASEVVGRPDREGMVASLFGMPFGEGSELSAIVYGLVGVAGVQALFWKGVQA